MIASKVSETEPIWFNLIRMEFPQPRLIPVSYTHLKIPQSCQIRKYNTRRNIGNQQPVGSVYFLKYCHISKTLGADGQSAFYKEVEKKAVSYTHLDVYKRQG